MSDLKRKTTELRSDNAALPYVHQDGTEDSEPVSTAYPLPVTVVGGGTGGGGSSEAATQTYAPQILNAGTGQSLTVPSGANRALAQVVSGSARMGLGSATVAPEITPGGGRAVSGAELAALRVDVLSGQVRVDYWRVG